MPGRTQLSLMTFRISMPQGRILVDSRQNRNRGPFTPPPLSPGWSSKDNRVEGTSQAQRIIFVPRLLLGRHEAGGVYFLFVLEQERPWGDILEALLQPSFGHHNGANTTAPLDH